MGGAAAKGARQSARRRPQNPLPRQRVHRANTTFTGVAQPFRAGGKGPRREPEGRAVITSSAFQCKVSSGDRPIALNPLRWTPDTEAWIGALARFGCGQGWLAFSLHVVTTVGITCPLAGYRQHVQTRASPPGRWSSRVFRSRLECEADRPLAALHDGARQIGLSIHLQLPHLRRCPEAA